MLPNDVALDMRSRNESSSRHTSAATACGDVGGCADRHCSVVRYTRVEGKLSQKYSRKKYLDQTSSISLSTDVRTLCCARSNCNNAFVPQAGREPRSITLYARRAERQPSEISQAGALLASSPHNVVPFGAQVI